MYPVTRRRGRERTVANVGARRQLRLDAAVEGHIGRVGYVQAVVEVLGIEVPASLVRRWRGWFAPEHQPFRTDRLVADRPLGRELDPSPEVRDTFHVYGGTWVWLEESDFVELSLGVRRALLLRREAIGHVGRLATSTRRAVESGRTDSRVVWWPSLVRVVGDGPVFSYVEEGVRPSRHREVSPAVWSASRRVLPDAVDLAGTFAPASGPNCFGTVMAAAGVPGADSQWMLQEPFEQWLADNAMPIRATTRDHLPGVVLVWRDADGLAAHAAVTIGDGYALSKPSQAWCSPRLVWTVRETISAARDRGITLRRHLLSAR